MDASSGFCRLMYRWFGRTAAVGYHHTFLRNYPAPVTFGPVPPSARIRQALDAYRPGWAPSELCNIMARNGSDKGIGRHNYSIFYGTLLKDLRSAPLNIFELGIGTTDLKLKSNMGLEGRPGASHRGWREFFPNAHVFGADIDRQILDQGNEIPCFYCDQTSVASIRALWSNEALADIAFDIIIDDGLHEFEPNRTFLESSIHKLARGGIYILEDIMDHDLSAWRIYVSNNTLAGGKYRMTLIELPHEYNSVDNNLLCVEWGE